MNIESNPNNFKTIKEAMNFVKDFMDTPYDELIEQGCGTMSDPEPEDDFYDTTTLDEFKELYIAAPKPGVCHTKKNVAKRQYITYLTECIKLKKSEFFPNNEDIDEDGFAHMC